MSNPFPSCQTRACPSSAATTRQRQFCQNFKGNFEKRSKKLEELKLPSTSSSTKKNMRTNSKFWKVVARKVIFFPNEQIFLHLTSLSITEDADDQQSGGERRRNHFGRTRVKLIKLKHRIIFKLLAY
jgi:hypothetical protein